MQLTNFLSIAALATAITANALPVGAAENTLEKRARPGFLFCKGIDWTSSCYKDQSPWGDCVTVGPDYNDQVSSARPDEHNWCQLYGDSYCAGISMGIVFPGSYDLRRESFNDMMSSFRCYYDY